MEEQQLKVSINRAPSFTEIWYEGFIEYSEETHKFWLIHHGNEYEIDIRWFFQRVPREVRAMVPYIIDAFKQKVHDTGKD